MRLGYFYAKEKEMLIIIILLIIIIREIKETKRNDKQKEIIEDLIRETEILKLENERNKSKIEQLQITIIKMNNPKS